MTSFFSFQKLRKIEKRKMKLIRNSVEFVSSLDPHIAISCLDYPNRIGGIYKKVMIPSKPQGKHIIFYFNLNFA